MTIYLDRGPFLTIPDKLHPGQYKVIRNPEWRGELPEIVSFTDFLKWNYTLEYGRYIRNLHYYRQLPLPWNVPWDAEIETVIIEDGRYDRIDHDSFDMYVICGVVFNMDGCRQYQKYIVDGYYCSYGGSNFLCSVKMYNGEFIWLNHPLDESLVPILSKKDFESIAQEILGGFYSYKSNYPCRINTVEIAKAMELDIKYARLSKNGKVKSKLVLDKRDTTVYDKEGKATKMHIGCPTILVDESLEDEEAQNAIIHECIHSYLHNLFYELQSYYRKMVGRKMPEFNDYFYSKTQRSCLKWMETQANAIPRFVQMPEDETSDVILGFFEKLPGEPDWEDYRELIDLVKWKSGVSRNAAKKRVIELGWPEVRGVYVYNTTGYVEDYDVELRFPDDYTYTLSFRHISEVFASCEAFAELVRSKKFIYLDGHVVINSDKYIRKECMNDPSVCIRLFLCRGSRTAHTTIIKGALLMNYKLIYICSPMRPILTTEPERTEELNNNIALARDACTLAVYRGFLPVAPHLYFPQFLNDDVTTERNLGLDMGKALLRQCTQLWIISPRISQRNVRRNQGSTEVRNPSSGFHRRRIQAVQRKR